MARSNTTYYSGMDKNYQPGYYVFVTHGHHSSMYQRLLTILCSLSCIILLMPQGWCCWLAPLSCCQVIEKKSCCRHQTKTEHSCCSQHTTSPESDQPAPLPVKCAKCVLDTIKPSFAPDFDLTFELLGLLPVDFLEVPPVSLFFSPAHLHGNSPPLHVQLCVWRC